ncbi:MAG: RluA family pseudouridine synthase [Clostridia bacterium]|nr:RluA family pseudouridine synthase [Clostridia bacterium]
MRTINETVGEDFSGRLIKDFLRQKLSLSVTLIKKVKFGGVFVNGECVTMRKVIYAGDSVTVNLPSGEESEHVEPIDLPLTVLYEDEYILAVDKPINMPTHPSRYNSLVTLANLVRAYVGEAFVFRAITRLDRDTSGIVLIAKDQHTASLLSAEMKAQKIEKTYSAILRNVPSEPSGRISAPIEREAPDSIKRIVREDGKSAVTEYKVTEILSDGRAVCEVNPITGRTHQIRVHMAYIGAPLDADFLYGERKEGENYSLRCVRLVFTHPYKNEKITINA